MNMQMVARGWFVYDLTSSALDLAWVTMSFMLPQIFLALPGGVIADRTPKRVIIFWSQLLNFGAALVMSVLILAGKIEFYHFIVLGIFSGSILAISFPARHAMIPDVLRQSLVFSGIALNTSGMNFARVFAPALAGYLIFWIAQGDTTSAIGVGVVYIVITVLYLIASLFTLLVSVRGEPHDRYEQKHPLRDIQEGLAFVGRHPSVFALVLISILPFLFAFPLNTFLPAFNEEILNGGPDDLGVLLSVLGIGSIIGSLMLAMQGSLSRKGFWLVVTTFGWGVAVVVFGISKNLLLAAAVIGFVGWFSSWNGAMNRALTQAKTRPEILSRVLSIDMMSHGLMPLGLIPIGFIADYAGVDIAITVSGLLFIASVAILYLSTPTVRHLMKPDSPHLADL